MLDKKYNHLEVEKNKYSEWLKEGYFNAGDLNKEPFCIVIPPPNVTGKLHLGHAWDTTLQDIIIRYKRMDGYDALWLPGMDHAGIATQAKVDSKLKSMGIKPREMDREEWLKQAWKWKEEYAQSIKNQWAKLGLSLDYNQERFTMDEGLSEAVKYVFITLYEKGYIYRGERIINWDPEAMTALSNEEVIYQDIPGAFYHLKYKLEGSDDYLDVATTRPETLFGDTAVAVNPKDERYKHLVGKYVILPIVNKRIPIIADEHADMEKGTGVVKITPAHDPNDFEVGNRHQLERVVIMHPDATMNENAYQYEGMTRETCREALLKDLEKEGLLLKTEKIVHSVGHSERTNIMVEPYLSKQWFVKMDTLAKQVVDNQKTEDKVNFVPKRFEKVFVRWMENCHDWCISRQLWWGHRIPAWYKGDEVYVGYKAPKGDGWIQDSDVLDTWFSSALWPFSTLNWPHNLNTRYFPNDVLVTGYDIIFFWVARMVFQSLEFNQVRPFKEVLIHGLIRDKNGRKMSKSLGNGVDPMDVIEKYGADSLRFFITTSTAPGTDLRYDEEKVAATWNFINKLWNASRFVQMNLEDFNLKDYNLDNLTISDEWIITKLNKTIKVVRKYMDKYEFNTVGSEIYRFVWNDFCDWYIELSKINMNNNTKSVLIYVLSNIVRLLHPFMPYVTDEIYRMLPTSDKSITISQYPIYNKKEIFNDQDLDSIIELIKKIRKIKLENNIGKDYFLSLNGDSLLLNNLDLIKKVLKQDQIMESYQNHDLTKIDIRFNDSTISLYYDGKLTEEDLNNLQKEKERLINSINRRQQLLSNENYVSKAPTKIVEEEKKALIKEEKELKIIEEKLQ
ncbi:MAG: valine--tRNA ligase [Bacilli bacterium]|nr:valine--tRNA ligase [Bacilli bacterium]MDD4808588.1 valine--tRNA ligase [Bacilli bacterium]